MNTVVVKLGGHALDEITPDSLVLRDIAHDVSALNTSGSRVVIVHGGGPQITSLLAAVGVEGLFHEGLRVTDDVTMSYVAMALSAVNVQIVAALGSEGLPCIGLSGADASLLQSVSLGEPWLLAGSAPVVTSSLLDNLWRLGLTPVMNSLAIDATGRILNCNADSVAGAVAGAFHESVLVLLSDIDQLRADPDDPSSALSTVTSAEVRRLVETGSARDGMRPKLAAALDALASGATRIIIANGTRSHALANALAGAIPTTEVLN